MFRPWRSLLLLVMMLGGVWCAFQVPLGELTFAQHMDRIGQTSEAEALLQGTRSVMGPMLEEAKGRLLGEYIEAPTDADAAPPMRKRAGPPSVASRP